MKSLRGSVVAGACAVACALVLPAAASAATATVTGTLTGSTLSLSTSATPSFSDNLDLGDQTPTYTVPTTLQDTRGTGAGWNLTITSTQFTTGGATPNTLATNASSLTGVTSSCASGTCTNPTNSVTGEVLQRRGQQRDGQVHGHADDRRVRAAEQLRGDLYEHPDAVRRKRSVGSALN